ncbi:MAG: glycoside hydrolase family 38 C-terminal domain-containing protein [Phycisphaerales bacterium]|nr:glycoside hydrolase family 38 C-terminal domain-containing protein [Phycisphaerales bacterium]
MHRHEYDDVRFKNFQAEVLSPARFPARSPLSVSVWQTEDRGAADRAASESYEPVVPGWRWGPVWSTAWFRMRGAIPDGAGALALRFSSGTEALLRLQGLPYHGLDVNHDLAVLPADASVEDLLVEAACNLPLGISTFWWDEEEIQARWRETNPGRLEYAELVRLDPIMQQLTHRFDFARQLCASLPVEGCRAQEVAAALHRAMTMLAPTNPRDAAAAALEVLDAAIGAGTPTGTECRAIGHAHIDTAWLWTLNETRRKCTRTFATMLRLMERSDDFVFLCSQAQQYAWMEADEPDLFAQIHARVREGRWEAGGGMWVEPDCLIPSGESLIRQILKGTGWWVSRFGDAALQRHLYLPDTFGFPASLPQIARQSGLDTFITNKIAWNEVNAFPHVTFRWRGIDGTDIVSHMTPGHNYNSEIAPSDLLAGEGNVVEKDHGTPPQWLQPFGYGDGGGGPTETQIDRVHASRSAGGLPATRFTRADAFCDSLHEAASLPVWDGELYMEGHRGIYTSQAWLKRTNLDLEESLRIAELVAGESPERAATIDGCWTSVLLHQFHDILPGSSIAEVYADACEACAEASTSIGAVIEAELGTGDAVFNPASTSRSGVVRVDGELRWADGVPALASSISTPGPPASVRPVVCDGTTLDNGLVSFRVGGCGCLKGLRSCDTPLDVATDDTGWKMRVGEFRLYEDRPRQWDAWNLDHDYRDQEVPLDRPRSVEVVEAGPLRAVIEVQRTIGQASAAVIRYTLDAGSRRVDVQADIEWHEDRRVLRVDFPTSIRSRVATCGIQFGCLERPTHRNTSWERAQFEVPGHRWMDLSEPGRGLAILDRAIYGRSVEHGLLGLTLLRASVFPDPNADRGAHSLRWALMPHAGDWRAAGVDAEAETLTRPFRESTGRRAAPFAMETIGPIAVEIAAVKPSEDGRARIVRLVEKHGGHGTAVLRLADACGLVQMCDCLERPAASDSLVADGRAVRVGLRPFEIATIRIEHPA